MPAVMIPQWHRGTEWGRDAARGFHEEVEAAVARGDAVCADERLRLMWVGRGLWFNLGFYQHFQEQFGAVFVWSMYLAIAADGYPRYGGTPLRQLAARFVGFADFLGMPGWADQWYLQQAQTHRIDGVVHLVSHDSRSSYFTTKRARGCRHPRDRDRRRQRRRADLGRARVRRAARAFHRGARGAQLRGSSSGPKTGQPSMVGSAATSKLSVRASSSSRNEPHLEPPRRRARALVRAVSESEVRVRVTVRPERLGVVEQLRVAVGGGQDERHPLAGPDRPAADLDIVRRRAGEALVGCVEPKQLLDDGGEVSRLLPQGCLQLGVARQVQDCAPDQRRRRDVGRNQQLPEAARDELVVERLAVDPRREQRARRIELAGSCGAALRSATISRHTA